MTTDKIQTTEESLAIITAMIRQTKRNVRGGSFHFILWGWVSVIAFTGHFLLETQTDYAHPYIVWLITIPAWIISMWYGRKKSKEEKVRTYGDSLIMWTWIGFSMALIIIIFSGQFFRHINELVLLLAGLATFNTGLIIRYRPLIIGGSLFWVFAAIALAVPYIYTFPVAALAIVCGYLIPGYMLRKTE